MMTTDDVRRLEKAIEEAVSELRDDIASLRRDAGAEIGRLRKDVKAVTEFQVGFKVISKVMTFLLAAATTGAAVYGAFWRK